MRENNSRLDGIKKMIEDVQSSVERVTEYKKAADNIIENALKAAKNIDDPLRDSFLKDSEKIINGVNNGNLSASSSELQEYLNKYGKGVSKK